MDSPDVQYGTMLYGVLKSGVLNAAATTNPVNVWVPASGKAIRLSSYQIEVSSAVIIGVAGPAQLILQTTTVIVASHQIRLGNAALATYGTWGTFAREFPGGLLLPRGETLTISTTATIGAGGGLITCNCFGREE